MSRRLHLALGLIAMLLGLAAAISGFWWAVAANVLLLIGQVIGYRNSERARG